MAKAGKMHRRGGHRRRLDAAIIGVVRAKKNAVAKGHGGIGIGRGERI
jgi:hypothetical protein